MPYFLPWQTGRSLFPINTSRFIDESKEKCD